MTATLHLAAAGSDRDDGSEDHLLGTIGKAAALAQPGDTVLVHVGEYREWVQPARGGFRDTRRITYAAVPGDHVVIKGLGTDHRLGDQRRNGVASEAARSGLR